MIEIHLDGKPVTKLEAARALAVPGRTRVFIGEPNEFGIVHDSATVYGRYPAYGAVEPPALNCASFTAGTAAEMRQRAEMITLAAEIAELAEMLAAEQVTEFTTGSGLAPARCRKAVEHHRNLAGATVDCDVAAHHEPALSLVGRIVVDHADDSPCPVTGKVVGQVDEDTVEVLWGERQFEENPGQGTYEPIDALRLALQQRTAEQAGA